LKLNIFQLKILKNRKIFVALRPWKYFSAYARIVPFFRNTMWYIACNGARQIQAPNDATAPINPSHICA